MEKYFNIQYEFDRASVIAHIDDCLVANGCGYVTVVDGVVLASSQRDASYLSVIQQSMFSICDSSWVPLYLRLLYGIRREQYCGSMIFEDIVKSRKYKMSFIGAQKETLDALQRNLAKTMNPEVDSMLFYELPFCKVEDFDYVSIAALLDEYAPDIIWVSLGAPKQEQFMNRLSRYLHRGVQISVGAVFKFYSGQQERRAPAWIVKAHLEFIYRVFQDPSKQIRRCWLILSTMPSMLLKEIRQKHQA